MGTADWVVMNKRPTTKLSDLTSNNRPLLTEEDMDERVAHITRLLQRSVREIIILANQASYSKLYWTKEDTKESWIAFNISINQNNSQIKKDKLIG